MAQSPSKPPPVAETARLFLALCPGPDVSAALAAHTNTWRWPTDAQRYAPADWHVTLHFIGPVPRSRIDALRTGLKVPMKPFELRWGEPALWPHGLAVLLPIAIPEPLQALHAQLGQALRRRGLKTDERAYRPHLTLARHAAQAQPPARWPAFGWQVQGYALMESTGQAGLRYRVLQHFGAPV
jgi:2'-5' RNA ligase